MEYINYYKDKKNKIYSGDILVVEAENFPILVGNKIIPDYYNDIYRYLYMEKYNLAKISRYPEYINKISNVNMKYNKKKNFRIHAKSFYLDEDNKLYKKIIQKEKIHFERKIKLIEENNKKYLLYKIPNKLEILNFLEMLHRSDNHRGINSLRNYVTQKGYYIEGLTFLANYIIKSCAVCLEKASRIKLKKESVKQILTSFPKERYVMDLSELPLELCREKKLYLFCMIDHFSEYGMAYIIENKESKTILKYLKIALECNGFPEEIGSDNGSEFKNELIEKYLNDNEIKFIHGSPYNPHSQGVVERFHQTIKDLMYSIYADEKMKEDLKEYLDIALKKYNNHIHSSTRYKPNEIFYSTSEELFKEVLGNIKNSFKNITGEFKNFEENEKCLLNGKFKIQKKYNGKEPGILLFDKLKNKKVYTKFNVIIQESNILTYKIMIVAKKLIYRKCILR